MLWLLRHAEASEGRPDEARPLTQRGATDARAIGLALSHMGVRLGACLTSPKRRAFETARLACAEQEITPVEEPALAHGSYDPERLALGLGEDLDSRTQPDDLSSCARAHRGTRGHAPGDARWD